MVTKSDEAISRQPTWIGGVNDFLLPDLIPETSCVSMLNLDASEIGTLRRRPPVSTRRSYLTGLDGIDQQPRLLKVFQDRHHGPVLIAITDASDGTSHVFIDDGTSSTPLDLVSPHKLDSDCDIVPLFNRAYIVQPGQATIFWEWGNVSLHVEEVGTWKERFPPCGTAAYFKGRGWAGDRDIVFYSTFFAASELESPQLIWDTQAQGHRVTTGFVVKVLPYRTERLLVLTTGGFEVFLPNQVSPTFTQRSIISSSIGCSSKQTAHILGEDVLWIDHRGNLRSLIKTEADEPVGIVNEPTSLQIQGTIDRETKTRLFTSRATIWNGDYFFAIPTDRSPYPTELWRYSPRSRAFYGPWIINFDPDGSTIGDRLPFFINGLATCQFPGDIERLYILTRTAAGACRLVQFDPDRTSPDRKDGATVMRSRLTTRGHVFRNPERRKFPINLRIEGRFTRLPLTASMPSGATLESFGGACSGITLGISIRADQGRWALPSVPSLIYFTPDAGPVLRTADATLPFRLRPLSRQHANIHLPGTVIGRELEIEIEQKDLTAEFEIISLGLMAEERPVEEDA